MNDILFGNNNKAVIKKLANRSFHSNKMRNVIAAIAIALTTFLFTAVLVVRKPPLIVDYLLEIPFNFMKMELQPRSLPLSQKPQLLMEM